MQGRRYTDAQLRAYLQKLDENGETEHLNTLKQGEGSSAALPDYEVTVNGGTEVVKTFNFALLDSARLGQLAQEY